MKRPSEARGLTSHREQALGYWRRSADPKHNIPAPRYVVLRAFQRFEIWEPGAYPREPRAGFDLHDLPDRMDALMFPAGREPVFTGRQEPVTREVVMPVTNLYDALRERRAAGPDELRYFVLQAVWYMFAEHLGQLEGQLLTRLVDELLAHSSDPATSASSSSCSTAPARGPSAACIEIRGTSTADSSRSGRTLS
jgi:hypothetical protein